MSLKRKIIFTPQTIRWCLAFVFAAGFLSYLGVQIRAFISAPQLTLFYPSEDAIVKDDFLVIKGKTSRAARIFINSQEILVGVGGEFTETINLPPGLNLLNFKAMSREGKETYVQRIIQR